MTCSISMYASSRRLCRRASTARPSACFQVPRATSQLVPPPTVASAIAAAGASHSHATGGDPTAGHSARVPQPAAATRIATVEGVRAPQRDTDRIELAEVGIGQRTADTVTVSKATTAGMILDNYQSLTVPDSWETIKVSQLLDA